MIRGERAESFKSANHWDLRALNKLAQLRNAVALRYAAANVKQRLFRLTHQLFGFGNFAALAHFGLHLGIGPPFMALRCHRIGDIFGKVNQDRPRSPFGGDEISFGNHTRQIRRVTHNIAMLYAGQSHTDDIDLLERVCAHQICRHLTRDKHDRYRIEIGVRYGRNQICRPRPRRSHRRANFARCARITNGGHTAALFMSAQNMTQIWKARKLVIDGHNRPARISKNHVHALRFQTLQQELRA